MAEHLTLPRVDVYIILRVNKMHPRELLETVVIGQPTIRTRLVPAPSWPRQSPFSRHKHGSVFGGLNCATCSVNTLQLMDDLHRNEPVAGPYCGPSKALTANPFHALVAGRCERMELFCREFIHLRQCRVQESMNRQVVTKC